MGGDGEGLGRVSAEPAQFGFQLGGAGFGGGAGGALCFKFGARRFSGSLLRFQHGLGGGAGGALCFKFGARRFSGGLLRFQHGLGGGAGGVLSGQHGLGGDEL